MRNVFHQRRELCDVSLLPASLPTVRICGQRQREISCAWRGCARRGAAARHKHVRIFACVVRYVCEYILLNYKMYVVTVSMLEHIYYNIIYVIVCDTSVSRNLAPKMFQNLVPKLTP